MVMIIHGFPNDIAALRFEWAWQHPHRSRRLNHVAKKKAKEKAYDFCLRVLSEMFLVGPWNRLPLTIRWLNQEYAREFPHDKLPPMHMPICYGPVLSKKLPKVSKTELTAHKEKPLVLCRICFKIVEDKPLTCLNPNCDLVSHVVCLSKSFCELGEYIPIEGRCPSCNETCLWGDLVRKYKGCYGAQNLVINMDLADEFYSSDSD